MMGCNPIRLWTPFDGGSSGLGISKVVQTVTCPKQAYLDHEAARRGKPNSFYRKDVWTGSIIHELLRCYYTNNPPHVEIDPMWKTSMQFAYDTAWRVFRRYRAEFPANEFGRPLECEADHAGIELFPHWKDYSMKLDMVVKSTQRVVEKLAQTREVILFPNYYYIIDHKTTGSLGDSWQSRYLDSLQFIAYSLAFQKKYPKRKYGGMLVNIIGTTTSKVHRSLLVPPPNRYQIQRLSELKRAYDAASPMRGNPTACLHYGKPCYWLHNGCEGY